MPYALMLRLVEDKVLFSADAYGLRHLRYIQSFICEHSVELPYMLMQFDFI